MIKASGSCKCRLELNLYGRNYAENEDVNGTNSRVNVRRSLQLSPSRNTTESKPRQSAEENANVPELATTLRKGEDVH